MDHLGLLITLGMVALGWAQLYDARHQRDEAREALNRARSAENTASALATSMTKLRQQAVADRDKIKSVADAASAARTDLGVIHGGLNDAQLRLGNLQAGLGRNQKEVKRVSQHFAALDQRMRDIDIITKLASAVVNDGSRSALDRLEDLATRSEQAELGKLALTELLRVKMLWWNMNRIVGLPLSKAGKPVKDSELNTCDLIDALRTSPWWQVRARSAELLAGHKETGVAEVLLGAIESDQQLHVVRDAVVTWTSITGHPTPDVFDSDKEIEAWWKMHAQEVSSTFSRRACELESERPFQHIPNIKLIPVLTIGPQAPVRKGRK